MNHHKLFIGTLKEWHSSPLYRYIYTHFFIARSHFLSIVYTYLFKNSIFKTQVLFSGGSRKVAKGGWDQSLYLYHPRKGVWVEDTPPPPTPKRKQQKQNINKQN